MIVPPNRRSMLGSPLTLAPILLPLFCIGMVLVHLARFGTRVEADEGTEAHLFQLFMVLQVPLMVLFAAKWWPVRRQATLVVLALQGLAAAAALALVFFLKL